jgi:hypothetical protein
MPHIIILEELDSLIGQMNEYSHQIADGDWKGSRQVEAEAIQAETETLANSINTSFRTQIEDCIAEQEAFLGI